MCARGTDVRERPGYAAFRNVKAVTWRAADGVLGSRREVPPKAAFPL